MSDKERERSKDRPVASSSGHHHAPSSSQSNFFLGLFGGGSRKAAPATTTRAHATTQQSKAHVGAEEMLSPRSVSTTLQLPNVGEVHRAPSPLPFDLQTAIEAMQVEDDHTGHLPDMVQETAAYIGGMLPSQDPFSNASRDAPCSISLGDIRTLYIRATAFANAKSDPPLRIAAIRLLAALIATYPPVHFAHNEEVALPDIINVRSLYKLIVAPTSRPGGSSHLEAVYVEVGALSALTKVGKVTDGLDGIVGWLLRTLKAITPDFAAWCAKRDDWDTKKTACEAAIAIINLLHPIVIHHATLFSPADITRIVEPALNLIMAGMAAITPSSDSQSSASRRASPIATAMNSPITGALGFEPSLRQSIASGRSWKDVDSSSDARRHSVVRQLAPPELKWLEPIPSLYAFLNALITETSLSDQLFKTILMYLCLHIGQDDLESSQHAASDALSELLHQMLSAKAGRRGEQFLYQILEGKTQLETPVPDADRKIARGAVVACRVLYPHVNAGPSESAATVISIAPLGSYLRAVQSTSRFVGNDRSDDRAKWRTVDVEVLALLQDHLMQIERIKEGSGLDVWTEGSTACDILHGVVPLVHAPARRGAENEVRSVFEQIVHQIPQALFRLAPNSTTAPYFYHPKYIELLLDVPSNLDEEDASIVIDFYQRDGLCLPFTSNWIRNIWKLLEAFYLHPNANARTRKKVTSFLMRDVYRYAEDLPEHRIQLVDKALVPFLEKVLMDEQDEEFVQEVLAVLVNAAVAETMERDDERRRVRAEELAAENEEEDASALPSEEHEDSAAGGSFDAIRTLIVKLATQTACKDSGVRSAPVMSAQSSVISAEGASVERKSSTRSREAPSGLRGLVEALSPPRQTKELPAISAIASPVSEDAMSFTATLTAPTPSETPPLPPHTDCRSLHAVTSLIAIFVRLAFTPPQSFPLVSAPTRTPASSRSIQIYRDLLALLFPMTDDSQGPTLKIPSRCPRSRVIILQFLTRLRADSKHRIYLRTRVDEAVAPYAAILKRTRETEKSELDEAARRFARSSARTAAAASAEPEERGRATRQVDSATRSRSRSKAAIVRAGPAAVDPTYTPLWRVPDEIAFERPADTLPSQGMTTYDPNHPSLKDPSAPPVEGVWLPVSEYVRVLNGILRGHDWELVSYVLTFLPVQLSNKLFFHGRRATKEVRALLDVLISGVMPGGAPWERRFNVPSFIKRADINSAAYQSLSILISYRGVFSRAETDRMIQAFMSGLQGREQLAKPCLQALTLSVYELEQSVSRNLTEIIRAMTNVLTTTGLAVHILEFLIALGQNQSLFKNFTDEQYRLVFRIAIGYITEHNARSDGTVDLREPTANEAYILSQHVIGLAYYAIYIWFLALRLPQRPALVTDLTREILKGRSTRVLIDEMAEVCFDWLARYTYGNADPKPANSFLSEVVMRGSADSEDSDANKSASWMLGGAIITVTSHPRSGWATITTTRPTGTTQVVCKVENVPLVGLGEAEADLVSLPAVLMANRAPDQGGGEGGALPDAQQIVAQQSTAEDTFDQTAQHGYIWSGATPSQRRKEVIVDPSYLALQLLSSYPNASLDTPRGRLIPPEDKFTRALRGIQNTPVIDTLKIAVLYVGPGQTTETEILGNIDGSPLYLDFLSGLGRLIRLKGQVDVFVGGLNRDNDSDGEYAYAWWDDLTQLVFHTPTMMPNLEAYPQYDNKKRLVGNDYVKIIYNDSGTQFAFDTIKTAWNFINIVISPFNTGAGEDDIPRATFMSEWRKPVVTSSADEGWQDWDREDWFKVTVQRAPGIPDFSPIGTHKLVSRRALPILVRHFAHLANDLAARFVYIREAADASSAEYITSWRARLRAMHRMEQMLPPKEVPAEGDVEAREQMIRDFTRLFTYRPPPKKED